MKYASITSYDILSIVSQKSEKIRKSSTW